MPNRVIGRQVVVDRPVLRRPEDTEGILGDGEERQPERPFGEEDGRILSPDAVVDEMENLRKGTRHQYISDWTPITFNLDDSTKETATFSHGLEEIPWVVDVEQSFFVDGMNSTPAVEGTDVDTVKTDETVTVTTKLTETRYFRVRAM